MGSSPRVRGTLLALCGLLVGSGIIPACAGNTTPSRRRFGRPRDHPRVCGEHYGLAWRVLDAQGSSPRVRGTQLLLRVLERRAGIIPACAGIIPACAGNTRPPSTCRRCSRDHPRVCGEHPSPPFGSLRRLGSSPRVRGTQEHPRTCGDLLGIIPACAGNTSCAAPT